MRLKACHSPEAGFTLNTKKRNKHLQIGCWLRKGQPGACKKSRNRSLKISSLFQIYGIGALGPRAPGSSLLDTLGRPSLSASVTLRDSRTTPPGYCVNTKNWHILGWGEKNKLKPKSKEAGLEGLVIAVQKLLKEAFTCPRPSVLPASSPCGVLPMAFGEPSGLLLVPASCQDNVLPSCPSAHRPGYYKSRFACQATHTCCHQK